MSDIGICAICYCVAWCAFFLLTGYLAWLFRETIKAWRW